MVKKVQLPNLANATPAYLVDLLGETREEMSTLKRQEGWVKQALKARIQKGQMLVEGTEFEAEISNVVQERFDSEAARNDMGPDWAQQYMKTIEFETIRVKRVKEK